jgi:hypothetical protein
MDPDAVKVRSEDGLATFDWPQMLAAMRRRVLRSTIVRRGEPEACPLGHHVPGRVQKY